MSKFWIFVPVLLLVIALVIAGVFLITPHKTVNNVPPPENKFPIQKFVINKFLDTPTTVILVGDIMLGRSVMTTSLSKNNPNYPFEKVAGTLKEADLIFGNLENPIIADCPNSDSGFKFCADPKMLQGLLYAGVDVLTLANNHTKNYGVDGFTQTKNYLTKSGIDYVGDNNFVEREINGIRFGFLGFDFVVNESKASDFELIKEAKSKVDVLFVMIHWGVEYTSSPTTLQKLTARKIIEAGADVLVGAHPHWVQDLEYIGEKPVFYSLGNFVFDQPWSEGTKKGMAIRLTYNKEGKISNIENLPVYMRSIAQPEWVK
jgi:poly-gamma-glutamate synthesis protein (capsule biosynthesis protein)